MDPITTNSISNLCLQLISFGFQRCRVSEDLCRLSVALNCSRPPLVRISISDTGGCSSLEEFQDLKFTDIGGFADKWDGMLAVRTTGISDELVYNYNINLKEVTSTHWLTRLPATPKNSVKFSGTEVCLLVSEEPDVLPGAIKGFFQKMLILNIHNIALELIVNYGDATRPEYKNAFLPSKQNPLLFEASNIERLKYGFEDYFLNHGNSLSKNNSSSAIMECVKAGIGTACCSDSSKKSVSVMEAVIILCELPDGINMLSGDNNNLTEVLYFKDYSLSPIPVSSQNALRSIEWKSYGLILRSITKQDGRVCLEWENLPPYVRISFVFHCYQKQPGFPPAKQNGSSDRNLLKKAVKLALDDLKEKHKGILLSDHAVKICSYAPDLARTLAGLIFSSKDSDFQGECFSLLGLQPEGIEDAAVEECLKEKLISVIEMNDKKPERCKEPVSLLFGDDYLNDLIFEVEYEDNDGVYDLVDV